MSIYQWLCVLGIPSLVAGLFTFVKLQLATNKAVKLGLQAILRDRLTYLYSYYAHQGWADDDTKRNVQNLYDQYEILGRNGIIDRKHDQFLNLPDEDPNGGGNEE